jgi:hypothetical protein
MVCKVLFGGEIGVSCEGCMERGDGEFKELCRD